MAFTIITLDGVTQSGAGRPPIGQFQIVVAPGDPSLLAQPISRDNPFPTYPAFGVSGIPPIEHVFNAPAEISPAVFAPLPGRPFNITLTYSNDAAGIVMNLIRSFDDGVTWHPVTTQGNPVAWLASASEIGIETEVGVKYALQMIERADGSVATRMSQ